MVNIVTVTHAGYLYPTPIQVSIFPLFPREDVPWLVDDAAVRLIT